MLSYIVSGLVVLSWNRTIESMPCVYIHYCARLGPFEVLNLYYGTFSCILLFFL
ncbi:hypothetical protein Fmac_011896 [Flemingia macrophylla]|uniref:Uncharacterized protein n=1 Tax=Flemingia macrophylla TaxID=520843 RepID=A0ABD1MNR7_9FABA